MIILFLGLLVETFVFVSSVGVHSLFYIDDNVVRKFSVTVMNR